MRISRRSLFGIGLAPWCWSCATRGLHWHDNSLYENTRISFTRSVEDARHQVRSVDLYTMRIDGDEERKIAEGFVRQPTWSPNGRNIAYVDAENVLTQQRMPSRLKLVSVESQKTTSLGVCDARAKLAFSPDGTWLACTLFMARPGEVIGENWGTAIVNVHTSEIRKFKFESGGLPLWSPDGQRLLLHDCGSYVIDLRTNEGRKVLDHCTETTQWIDDTRFLVADGRKCACPLG